MLRPARGAAALRAHAWCCDDNDCPAAGQVCQQDGACACPPNQKVCDLTCIPAANCCTSLDCQGRACVAGTCAMPSCVDGLTNGSETDIDCGGGFCGQCSVGRTCVIDLDCTTGRCTAGRCVDAGFVRDSYGGGQRPRFLAAADLDGDGRADLVTVNSNGTWLNASENLSVLLGRGDGTFRALDSLAVGKGPLRLVIDDLDGDRRPDLVVVNRASHDLSVLLGRGDGTFARERRIAVAGDPVDVATGDHDGDRRRDLAVVCHGAGRFSVVHGDGAGGFARPLDVASPLGGCTSIGMRDLDGDALDDVVVRCATSGMQLFPRGAFIVSLARPGGFAAPVRYGASSSTTASLLVADLNADGRSDVILGGVTAPLEVHAGGPNATFAHLGDLPAPIEGSSLAAGDLDGDGVLDLVTGSEAHLGDRKLLVQQSALRYPPAKPPAAPIAVADFDGDKKLDLAFSDEADGSVRWLGGRGDGTFHDPRTDPQHAGRASVARLSPRAVALADLDGDGRSDALVASGTAPDVPAAELWVRGGSPTGALRSESIYPLAAGSSPSAIATGDFNRDGALDVLVGFADSPTALLLPGDMRGRGTLTASVPVAIGHPVLSLLVTDLDGDGLLDLVAGSPQSQLSWLHGLGGGRFAAARTFVVGPTPVRIRAADWDGDGLVDLVSVSAGSATFSWVRNRGIDRDGDVIFDAMVAIALPGVGALGGGDLFDFDGDGRLDAVATRPDGLVHVLRNASPPGAPPGLAAHKGFDTKVDLGESRLVDVDGDKRPDLLAVSPAHGYAVLLRGLPQGEFAPSLRFEVGPKPVAIASGDVDGDKRVDLLAASTASSLYTVLLAR